MITNNNADADIIPDANSSNDHRDYADGSAAENSQPEEMLLEENMMQEANMSYKLKLRKRRKQLGGGSPTKPDNSIVQEESGRIRTGAFEEEAAEKPDNSLFCYVLGTALIIFFALFLVWYFGVVLFHRTAGGFQTSFNFEIFARDLGNLRQQYKNQVPTYLLPNV